MLLPEKKTTIKLYIIHHEDQQLLPKMFVRQEIVAIAITMAFVDLVI